MPTAESQHSAKRTTHRFACRIGAAAVIVSLLLLTGYEKANAASDSLFTSIPASGVMSGKDPAASPDPSRSHWLPVVDVLIDVGHGGIDGGATHGDVLEKDINLAMAKQLYTVLQERNLLVSINRIGDYALSDDNLFHKLRSRHKRDLSQRSGIANRLKPRVMVSLHVNSARSSSPSGPLVLHQKSEESKRLAFLLQEAMNKYYNSTETPKFGKKYFILNQTKNPTVIVEMGYISNVSDRKRLLDPHQQRKLAEAIADGIMAFLEETKDGLSPDPVL